MLKRTVDIVISGSAIIILSPVFILLMLLIWGRLGRPIFFIQLRPGLRAKTFNMIKFRTMLNTVDFEGNLLPDSERLTKLGAFLRATSLDELPELWNVLRGDMSLVGPRPLSVLYLPYYTDEEFLRHDVRPGITGLAQVSGRNSLSWEEKFKLDLQYVRERSLRLDLKIFFMTFYKVLRSDDIGQGENMPASLHELRNKKYR